MFVLIGYIIVLGSVIGGFLLSGGHVAALLQPYELMIIGGAAVGAFIASNSPKVLKAVLKSFPILLKGDRYHKRYYIELLSLLFRLLNKLKKDGLVAIEADIENPEQSEIFTSYPLIARDHHVMDFIRDYFRLMLTGTADFFQIENLMDNDIETHHHEGDIPVQAITKLADGMPAFGIVAAVMGVVHTMESISLPPPELGKLVGAALVGTFLGILLGYGFIGPLAVLLEQRLNSATKALQCVKVIILATINNYSPSIAIEFGRKVLYSTEKVSNTELDELLKEVKANK